MDAKELAQQITGIEYPARIPKALLAQAKENGLVIVYGASDDLMEFEGAIHDEFGCYDGGVALLDSAGLLPAFESIDKGDKDTFRDYFRRESSVAQIKALWAAEEGYSWTYETDIAHATFEMMDEGAPYCRGIVFSVSDLAKCIPSMQPIAG